MSKAYSEEKLSNLFIQKEMCAAPGKQQSFELLEQGFSAGCFGCHCSARTYKQVDLPRRLMGSRIG